MGNSEYPKDKATVMLEESLRSPKEGHHQSVNILHRCWSWKIWEPRKPSKGSVSRLWDFSDSVCKQTIGIFFSSFIGCFIELDDGKIYRKTLYLMVKTMVSYKFSLKPIQWLLDFSDGWSGRKFQRPNHGNRHEISLALTEALLFRMLTFMLASGEVESTPCHDFLMSSHWCLVYTRTPNKIRDW